MEKNYTEMWYLHYQVSYSFTDLFFYKPLCLKMTSQTATIHPLAIFHQSFLPLPKKMLI